MNRPKQEDYQGLLSILDRKNKYIDDIDKYCDYLEYHQMHLENRISNLLDTCKMLRNIISDLNNELAEHMKDVHQCQ